MAHPKILAIVLAGGKGEQLTTLIYFRSKSAVPCGGRYRMVDFVLGNLVNSHIYSVYPLDQYKSQTLIEHVLQNWVLSSFIDAIVHAKMKGQHDFGSHVIPALLETGRVYEDDFVTNLLPGTMRYEELGYWRDVGTIPVYYQAHSDMLDEQPILDLIIESGLSIRQGTRGLPRRFLAARCRTASSPRGTSCGTLRS